jgi:hypothetical protein
MYWFSVNPNLSQPEKLVKLIGKHRNEKNLDKNKGADKNTIGWPNGSELCRGATRRG